MKTLVVECRFTIEVPWEEEWGDAESARFHIEENSCPGTGPVDGVLSELMNAAEENSVCWACNLSGENKLLDIIDRAPINYVDRITAETIAPNANCAAIANRRYQPCPNVRICGISAY